MADRQALASVFEVAELESAERPFAGLAILSFLCAEADGLQQIRALSPAALVHPKRRVGLRPITNDERKTINTLPVDKETGLLPMGKQYSARGVYEYYCHSFRMKPNSLVRTLVGSEVDVSLHELTEIVVGPSGYLGERGILPILELARHCPNLRRLSFPSNGLKNTAAECIAEMLIATKDASAPKLESIDLRGNSITIGGAKVLIDALQLNHRVTEVNVEGTKIEAGLQSRIRSLCVANQKWQSCQEEAAAATA